MMEYKRAKYINPNGQAVINSGYVWQNGDVIEVDYNITNTTAAGDKMILYSTGNGNGIWVETYGNKNVWYVRCGQTSSNSVTLSSSLRGTFRLQKGSFSVVGAGDLALNYNGPTGVPIYIGGRQDGTGCAYVDIYSMRVYRNGLLIKNYVPVQVILNGEFGLLETISGEIFTSITENAFVGELGGVSFGGAIVDNSGSLIINRVRLMDAITDQYIKFADPEVKQICATNWGTNGEITYAQAAAVTGISTKFRANSNITSFNELKYFTGLTSITGGTSNNSSAFYNCTALTSIVLPNTIKTIGGFAFAECHSLTSCNLPSSITSVGGTSFWNCSALQTELNLPNLTTLSLNAFYHTGITKVKNLGTITSLGGNAAASYGTFGHCPNLTEITLPATLTSTGNYNIQQCTALKRVVIESSATPAGLTIGTSCFDGDTALESITGLERVTSIAGNSFRNTTSLAQDINMPMLTSISGAPFFNSGITSVSSLGSITNLPGANNASSGAFRKCSSLTTLVLPSTCTTLNTYCLNECTSLTSVSMPGVTTINFYACWGTGPFVLNAPSLTSIGLGAFRSALITGIENLGQITALPYSGTSQNGIFRECTRLLYANIPDTVTEIGNYTFMGCTSLKNVNIGSGITTINYKSFMSCKALETFVVKATTPPTFGGNVFDSTNSTFIIYVPYSADHSVLDAYKAATGWSAYASRILELDEDGNIPE